uniref:DNA-binding protein inhibitor ID-4 n=1 Tax=Melopsittacus undulatus TaxID=13146 RepID=A0A8C6IQ61_MELUD
MKVAAAAPSPLPAGAGAALKAVRPGEAARCGPGPGVSPGAAEQAAAALLYDMKGCYSRLRALVPTLPRHRRVSKVELLQHVIDYIWDLQLALQLGPPRPAAAGDYPVCAPCSAPPSLPGSNTGCWGR